MRSGDLAAPRSRAALLGYLALWSLATAYLAWHGADWTFPLVSLLLFGGLLSAVVWHTTARLEPAALPVGSPRRESIALLAYLAVYAVVFIGWGLGTLKTLVAPGPGQDLAVLAYKLAVHVALPAALLMAVGAAVRPLVAGGANGPRRWRPFVLLPLIFFGLLAVVSPALSQLAGLGLAPAGMIGVTMLSWAWMSVEAGLCEEFLFRAALQTRLAAWFGSPPAAILLVSLVFALSHWPGLYLRGAPGTDGWSTDPWQVAAFTVATLSPLSVMLGVLWQRTGSLMLVSLVHGAIDALPHAAHVARVWNLAG